MFQSSCINCGCSDLQACITPDGPCFWLRVDEDAGEGVCSNCPDAVKTWDDPETSGNHQTIQIVESRIDDHCGCLEQIATLVGYCDAHIHLQPDGDADVVLDFGEFEKEALFSGIKNPGDLHQRLLAKIQSSCFWDDSNSIPDNNERKPLSNG